MCRQHFFLDAYSLTLQFHFETHAPWKQPKTQEKRCAQILRSENLEIVCLTVNGVKYGTSIFDRNNVHEIHYCFENCSGSTLPSRQIRRGTGWLGLLSVWLRLRSWSHSSWVQAPRRALLTVQSLEPASDSVSPTLSAPPLLTLCLFVNTELKS